MVTMMGTAGPDGGFSFSSGMRMLICHSPTKLGAAPLNSTVTGTPPRVTWGSVGVSDSGLAGAGFTGRELRRQNPLAGAKQLHDRARRRWLGARQAAIHRNYRAIFVERRHSPETGLGSNDLIPCIVAICEKTQ